jgi:anoctamin-10
MKDWLHGIRQIQPVKDAAEALTSEPLTNAERLRQVHHMINAPKSEGGAGITPDHGDWKNVDAIFPLHDHAMNKKWLSDFSRKTFLTPEDLDMIKDNVGEKIGFYYAFLQSYFTFMIFPAAFGFSCWVLLGSFSPVYGIVNILWCLVFVEYWKRQEHELSIRWGCRNVSVIQDRRRDFQPQNTITDSITGEQVSYFPAKKRVQRQLLGIPLAILSLIGLGTIICTCYAIEIFISEVYNGPFKSVLVFTPTILLTLAVPPTSNFLTSFASKLTMYENYETQEAHDKAMVSKVFVINFLTSYTAIFLTSFVYVPFASILVPYLDVFKLTVKPFAEDEKQMETPDPVAFNINPNRLKNQMIYFAVTAQVVNFAMETIVPFITKKGTDKFKDFQTSRAEKSGGAAPDPSAHDPPEEREFLARVREEASLPDYDVTSDLREMCIQFGYLSLFSVIWPLTPVSYFINNWIELRGDTFKLTVESRRPNPQRADSIGPWLDSLEFLAWLGSVTTAALVYMFSGSSDGLGPDGRPHALKGWALLLSIFFSEHIFLITRVLVRTVISKLDSANMRKERSERYLVRKKYLEDAGLADAVRPLESPASPLKVTLDEEKITTESLEEDARKESLAENTHSAAGRFWGHQRSWRETEKVGLGWIEMMDEGGEGKKQK